MTHQHDHDRGCGKEAESGTPAAAMIAPMPAAPVIDPVCGMTVDPKRTPHHAIHDGTEFHFCCAGCRTKFVADPNRYLGKTVVVEAEPVSRPGVAYICPMDPEIRQDHPGACPICGMALEPEAATLNDGPSPEMADMTRRFWVALALTLPIFTMEMGGHLTGLMMLFGQQHSNEIQLVLATPVVLWAGWPFFERGWKSLVSRHLNMFTLIALGVGVAFAYSVAATLLPWLFPATLRGPDGAMVVFFESASVIVTLVLLGQVLELRARAGTSDAVRALLRLTPVSARRIRLDGDDEDVLLEKIAVGDRLRIRPGETVPVDGVVHEGVGTLDESMMTGESMPVTRQAGERVVGGTLNQSGALVIRATQIGENTTLNRIIRLVSEAQRSRAPIQRLADTVAGWFVPVVLLVAGLAFAIWVTVGPEPRLSFALVAAVSVLIIACPCALGLATPMSIMVGMGRGARAGVLIRNAESLEGLEKVDTLVLDKTGTLTEGKPRVTAVKTFGGFDETELLRLAASLERASEHALASAIVSHALGHEITLAEPTNVIPKIGQGVSGTVEGRNVAVGQSRYLLELGVEMDQAQPLVEGERQNGAGVVLVAVDGELAGMVAVADAIKTTTAGALRQLRENGLRVVMLTGDHRETARGIARQLGITEFEAELLPEHKSAVIRRLQREGRVVAFAGDGMNDAPALAAANVGIAMGTGTDVAIQSAGVTLVTGDLMGIVRARALSRATMANIRQNLFFAFIYNAVGVPVAAGILYPAFGLLLSPVLAAAAMSLSSVSVIGNALRLRGIRLG